MQNKLQELTEKIYQEGVAKGNAEAESIIDNAKAEATQLIEKAKKEAESIIAQAKKNAEETKTNTESEIQLTAKQALNALKQQTTDLINGQIVNQAIDAAFNDKEFVQKIVDTTLSNWDAQQVADLSVLLPAEQEKELRSYFSKSIKSLLDKGLEIKFESGIQAGFQLAPKDGSYKLSFTDKDFENFFKAYLRPKLVNLLFAE